ncbi:DUF721 domain-containing protein [Pasteurellaceae bacterium TAE3-ERU1]|uniref:DciA family protein n=1 Tax=Spirabiliibacterium mucosae TaxID=28156 RepID=UPI001AAD67AE|nr:DciA family protein [Spirabiliibacterium mucosae]MBE2897649.1 DUF721 domain-containing protein [Spirabiliibacterium mucosae]MBV7388001.1 DUF721 domain-containing protein [Pasteurellaceae bacterium TAE3-ERU1]
MKRNHTKNITAILAHSTLGKIAQHASAINAINAELQKSLPAQWQGVFRVIQFREGVLCCEVQSAVVRQALLFQQGQILALAQRHLQVERIEFQLNPAMNANLP